MVEQTIANILPGRLDLVVEGWTAVDSHCIGVFAAISKQKEGGKLYENVLLALTALVNEMFSGAKGHFEMVQYVLSEIFKKTMSNVVALTGDCATTNRALAFLLGCGFAGGPSHRFN